MAGTWTLAFSQKCKRELWGFWMATTSTELHIFMLPWPVWSHGHSGVGERIIIFLVRFYGISSNFIHLVVCVNRITRNILFVTLARILRESAGTFPLLRISVPLLIAKVVQGVKPSQPTTMQPKFRPLCKNVALFSETIYIYQMKSFRLRMITLSCLCP